MTASYASDSAEPPVLRRMLLLLLGVSLALIGNGLQTQLVPIAAEGMGTSDTMLGVLGAAYSLGFIVACLLGPRVIAAVGHIRAFAIFAVIACIAILGIGMVQDPLAWVALRVLSGMGMASLFTTIEGWLNDRASDRNRGTVFSVYMTVNFASVTAGQMLLATMDPTSAAPFMAVAAVLSLALVPVALTPARDEPLRLKGRVKLDPIGLIRASPVGTAGALTVGLANGAFYSLGGIFALRAGLSLMETAIFMSAAVIGGAAAQVPLGKLSDRMDRRRVIMGTLTAAILLGLTLGWLGGLPIPLIPTPVAPPAWLFIALAGGFGFVSFPLYALSVAHTADHVGRANFVGASSTMQLLWGLGATLGPLLSGLIQHEIGSAGLFLHMALMHLALVLFTAWRVTRRAPVPVALRPDFQPAASTATTAGAELDPRAG